MLRILSAATIGLVFGVGIAISGMSNPAKVLNFFDVFGSWDPSLILVMGSALVVTFVGYRLVLRRPAPTLTESSTCRLGANWTCRSSGALPSSASAGASQASAPVGQSRGWALASRRRSFS
jgi:uncharacterized membrane protein YedE/YeeE